MIRRKKTIPSLKYLFQLPSSKLYEAMVEKNKNLDDYRRTELVVDYVLDGGEVKVQLDKSIINPILMIMSPRDIPEVIEAFNKIDYVDKVWFKYYDKPRLLREIRRFFMKHVEYTHLIIVSDDVFCPYNSIKTLIEDLIIYDFPVLSGCFNLCSIRFRSWADNQENYCYLCKQNMSHGKLNIIVEKPKKSYPLEKEYFVTEKWRRANPIIKRVWFQGFPLAVIRRDVYEKIQFRCHASGITATDLPWAIDLDKVGIPQFCDFGVKLRHRALPRDRELLVGIKKPKIVFQPAKKWLSQIVNTKFERAKTPTKLYEERQEYPKYLKFMERVSRSSKNFPPRPPKGSIMYDVFSKRHLNQEQWDELYGKWKSFIRGKKPKIAGPISSEVYNLPPRQKRFLNVLLLIDQFGWAFDFGARGIQKYSKHNCVIRRFWNDVTVKDIRKADVIFAFNTCAAQILHREPHRTAVKKFKPRVCIGVRAGPMEFSVELLQQMSADAIGCNSKGAYDFLVKGNLITDKKLYLTQSAVDHAIFKPEHKIISRNKFVVGWCGNATRKVKRTHLFSKLAFPISVKSDWGRQFFVKGRSQQPMADWYHTLDAYICVSETEGIPQPIMESMSSGLPVVSTAVGGIPDLLDKEWLVPVYPEKEVVSQINEKLQLLKDDLWLRRNVGQRNRQKIMSAWSWKHIVRKYDRMFEGN